METLCDFNQTLLLVSLVKQRLEEQVVTLAARVLCSKCQKPIVPGEAFAFVCFKVPGREGYHFFHSRDRAGDCWKAYLGDGEYGEHR